MSASIQSLMVNEPAKEPNLGRKPGVPGAGGVRVSRVIGVDSSVGRARAESLLWELSQVAAVRRIIKVKDLKTVQQELLFISGRACQPGTEERVKGAFQSSTNREVLKDAMGKERRESFRKRHTEQPFVMPKRSMETIADLDRG